MVRGKDRDRLKGLSGQKTNILHIVPDSTVAPKHVYLGSTKDIRGRTEYFKERGIFFDELVLIKRKDKILLKELKKIDLNGYSAAIIECPVYPRSVRFLKKKYPRLLVVIRSINAELFHRLHYIKASLLHKQWKSLAINLFFLFKCSLADFLCANYSDVILTISDWERQNYWRYITRKNKIKYLPYFVPVSYLPSTPYPSDKRQNCLCMMSTSMNSFLLDAAKNFITMVNGLEDGCNDWDFYITGDVSGYDINLFNRIIRPGFVEIPNKIMAESKVIALLSDYGFGFKTKLLDAIRHGCYALVTKGLYNRLPEEIKPYCFVVDINSADSFGIALGKCLRPFPEGNPNDIFRAQAFSVLDEILK